MPIVTQQFAMQLAIFQSAIYFLNIIYTRAPIIGMIKARPLELRSNSTPTHHSTCHHVDTSMLSDGVILDLTCTYIHLSASQISALNSYQFLQSSGVPTSSTTQLTTNHDLINDNCLQTLYTTSNIFISCQNVDWNM